MCWCGKLWRKTDKQMWLHQPCFLWKPGLKIYLHISIYKEESFGWPLLKNKQTKKDCSVGRISFSKMLPESNMMVVGKLSLARNILKKCQRLAGFETCWELFITQCGYLLALECAKWFSETHTESSEDGHIWCRLFHAIETVHKKSQHA